MGQSISDSIFEILQFISTAAFSTLRIWAIWDHALIPTFAVFTIQAVAPAINIYAASHITSFSVVDDVCLKSFDVPVKILMRGTAAIAGDLLVIGLTWVKTAGILRESLRNDGFRPTITTLLLRDGTVYFIVLLLMNVVSFIPTHIQKDVNGSAAYRLAMLAITANLISRFILDLRSVFHEGSSEPHTTSSVKFGGRSLAGNLGAPLEMRDPTWVSIPVDDVANARSEQYEEPAVPFRAI
ncbi:hypothetical protein EIP91_009240 [Steccherinum ochraceum]|uniref:Uncharacterized protein n=1 Tax=Steccherinum ochraceum TaxID=92696 RepID=A0A4R0R7B9_9APHY|nr:hypothetical protein EIP91_009240 [Steccherinum ochraceum]